MRQLELTQRILRLRGVPVFTAMSNVDIAPLAAALIPRTFQRGDVLLHEDAPPRSYFLVLVGSVTMLRKGNVIGTVRAPGGVGFMALMARNAGGTSAVAESYVEAYEVPADAVYEVFEDHFPVLLGSIRWVAERFLSEQKNEPPAPYVPPDVSLEHLIADRELGIVERIFLLRQTAGLRNANVNSVARFARGLKEVRIPAKTQFWKEGDVSDNTYFLLKGRAHTSWNDGASIQRLGPGYVVGGGESLVGLPRWNTLTTDDPVVMLEGHRDRLIDLIEDDMEMALGYLSLLSGLLMMIWDRKADAGIASVGSPSSAPMIGPDIPSPSPPRP